MILEGTDPSSRKKADIDAYIGTKHFLIDVKVMHPTAASYIYTVRRHRWQRRGKEKGRKQGNIRPVLTRRARHWSHLWWNHSVEWARAHNFSLNKSRSTATSTATTTHVKIFRQRCQPKSRWQYRNETLE